MTPEPHPQAEIYLSDEDNEILDRVLDESAKKFDLADDTDGQDTIPEESDKS